MDTASLRSFATWARSSLSREVSARITAVLAPASLERVEQPQALAELEKEIASAGGGAKGKAAVADKVAYTWFNRLIALRFMDANGYTNAGVVSPPAGTTVGQPEVLADAKRGVYEDEVVSPATRTTVTALLAGTRKSPDPQGEAYALLLADYCRYWNKAMPFMFERQGDYTELLIPANLLADDSVLNRALKVLTEDACQDVEVIGWLYQFYISERKDEVFAGFKKGKKAGAQEIPAATQLFTPHWIVRYLVENSLGRLWLLYRPTSRLAEQMDYYIAPVDEETDYLKITKPEELKVIDPACGSGHMLTYAFDLLYAIYEEEGYAPSDIPSLILTHNLYGTEIDPRAGALAAFALTMKARAKQRTFFNRRVTPNICVIEPITFTPDELLYLYTQDGDREQQHAYWQQFQHADILGALIQPDPELTEKLADHLATLEDDGDLFKADTLKRAKKVINQAQSLLPRYSVVVANPPYMGTRNMGQLLRDLAKTAFKQYAGDLCTMFIDRSLDLTILRGVAALVVSESWLFNTSYEAMRKDLIGRARPIVTACIDKSAFGVRLNTAASVFERGTWRTGLKFLRITREQLTSGPIHGLPAADSPVYEVDVHSFEKVPGGAFIFDMPAPLLALYDQHSSIGETFSVKQGLATADNGQFVRVWWEVSSSKIARNCRDRAAALKSGKRWFPYNKGGTPVSWWGNQDFVVNWERDGEAIRSFGAEDGARPRSAVRNPDFYFQSSITWSNIGSSGARFRLIPPGFIFDVAGMSVFTGPPEKQWALLGYLNSTIVRRGIDVLAPTLNYQVGDIARLPLVMSDGDNQRVERLVSLERIRWSENETAYEFQAHPYFGIDATALNSVSRTLHQFRAARDEERALLELQSDAYWSAQITELSGQDASEWITHTSRPIEEIPHSNDVESLISYAVGCMFGRYSLDKPGLILADQGATLQDYLAQVPTPTFTPDADNVIPIVDGDWFEDDIAERFRQFLRAAFGDEHFEENLRFVTEALGVKTLRDYFVRTFYKDHVQRYKKRPIYWLFSSPKGSFNALIYMHRYTPATASTVLNEYLREFQAKVRASLEHAQRANNAREADRLRKALVELDEYEHDVLYPLASRNIEIDLDDGVKINYPKLGAALKKIPGLEAKE